MSRTLIILVTNFPYGYGEQFIENELYALAKEFTNIYIVATDQRCLGNKIQIASISENVQVIEYVEEIRNKDKILAIQYLFSQAFFDDVRTFKKISISSIKIFLMEFLKAQKLSNFLELFIKKQQLPLQELYVYSYWNDFMSVSIANLKQKYPQIKGFSRAHGWDVYFERHPLGYLPLRYYISKHIDKIFFISQNGQSYYVNKFNIFSKKYAYSPLGTKNSLNLELIKKNKGIQIISCSSIIPLKNIRLMIDALSYITNYTIHWVHIGVGYLEDEIKEYATVSLGSKNNISFEFKGFMENEEVLQYYKSIHVCSALLNCSTTEGVPVSMMEAMSSGIPVIGTNVGGVSEIIEHETNGYLMSQFPSKVEVAATIERFCNLSDEEMFTMQNKAFTTWNTKYNADVNYKKYIQSINEL